MNGYEEVKDADDNVRVKYSKQEENITSGCIVWKAINYRLIPAISKLLTKETTDKNGSKKTTIRSPITLALFKLFQKVLHLNFKLNSKICYFKYVHAFKTKMRT